MQSADEILLMNKDGEIIDSGTYEQIATRNHNFALQKITGPTEQPTAGEDSKGHEELRDQQAQFQMHIGELRGQKSDWKSYASYIRSMGLLNFVIFICGATSFVVFSALFQLWLTWWTKDQGKSHDLGYWLGIYATWAVLMALALLVTPM